MNFQMACDLLGVPLGASDIDVKSAFKRMAIQYHPDRNNSLNATDKFKEINAAYQFLEKNGTSPPVVSDIKSPFYNISDHLADEFQRKMDEIFNRDSTNHSGPPIFVSVDISFKQAVLGCSVEISYTRISRCQSCKYGIKKVPCTKCGGTGSRKYGTGAVRSADQRELPCNACIGSGFIVNNGLCSVCHGSFRKQANETINVQIPAGITNGTQKILNGMGNYRCKEIYDDVIMTISVLPDVNGLILSGSDVISTVELSLLEALKGTKKSLHTIKGEKVLEFKPKIRNGERVRVSGFGVPSTGAHIFIVNVIYPEDVSKLIDVLERLPESKTVSE